MLKNRLFRIILGFIGGVFITYILVGQLGFLRLYHNISTANEPNLKIDSYVLVTNLSTPKNGDFVCFKNRDTILDRGIYIMRICATEYDTIEMKNTVVYVNNQNFDISINLVHSYMLDKKSLEYLDAKDVAFKESVFQKTDSTFLMNLEKNSAIKYSLLDRIIIRDRDANVKSKWNANLDNFDPIVVPKGKIFILGDNRHNSIDSRIVGFVDVEDIVGIVKLKL